MVYIQKPNELYTWNQYSLFYVNYTSIKVILKEMTERRNAAIKNKDVKDGVNSRLIIIRKVVTKKIKMKNNSKAFIEL